MEWQIRMRDEEFRLKSLVDLLAGEKGGGLKSLVERRKLIRTLNHRVEDTRAFVADCLLGRNSYEKYLMEYQLRMQFPLYSHLDSLMSMTELVFTEESCA